MANKESAEVRGIPHSADSVRNDGFLLRGQPGQRRWHESQRYTKKAGNAPMRTKRSSKLRRVGKMESHSKFGDKIRVTGIPNVGDTGEFKTRTVLEQCVGRVFRIRSFQKDWVELHLGRFVGKRSWEESIWVEPEFVELVKGKLRGKKSSRRKPKSR